MPILDSKAINELHRRQRFCYYCKRPVSNVSPRLLDCKVVRGGYRFYHTKCWQSSTEKITKTMSGKSTKANTSLQIKIERRNRHG